jgi:hypothetical protein
MRSILSQLVGSREELEERRAACENDFFLFCATYLPHYFSAEPAPYHRLMVDAASSMSLSRKRIAALKPLVKGKYHPLMRVSSRLAGIVDVEPRGFSLAFPLWAALYGKRRFLLLFASSQALAEERLEAIKGDLAFHSSQ